MYTEIWSSQFYLAYLLTFFLAFYLDLSGISSDIFSGILSGVSSDSLSDILSGISSDSFLVLYLTYILTVFLAFTIWGLVKTPSPFKWFFHTLSFFPLVVFPSAGFTP